MFGADALLGAGTGLLGGIVNNLFSGSRQEDQQEFNAQQAVQAMQFNRQEAQTQRDWTQAMSSTAYQRTMADMKAAGLNPILAYRQGSTPSGSGSSASGSPASSGIAPTHDIITPALSTATQLMRISNETKVADAQVEKAKAETETERVRPENVRAGTAKTEVEYQREKNLQPEYRARGKQGEIAEDVWSSGAGKIAHAAGLLGGSTAKAVSPITDLAGVFRRRWPSRSTTETTDSRTGNSTFSERFNY